MKALVICAYIGPLPNWFALWLRSAGANPSVDFQVLSDQPAPASLPGNVRFVPTSLAALRDAFSELAGFPVALETPYKLNDFKPLFWNVAQEIEAYDYWGYCDLDVVFGDLSRLLEPTLGRFDMVLSEGHLRFLRNDESTRLAWRDIAMPRGWRDILGDPANFGMDEHHGINRVFGEKGRTWFSNSSLVADLDPGFRQLRLLPAMRNYRLQAFYWENGRILREFVGPDGVGRDEFVYAHLQKRRMRLDSACLTAAAVDIGPDAFTPRESGQTGAEAIARRNPWHLPDAGEARILLREVRRRLTGRSTPFLRADTLPEGGTA